jgi:uncharacterized protein YuzE
MADYEEYHLSNDVIFIDFKDGNSCIMNTMGDTCEIKPHEHKLITIPMFEHLAKKEGWIEKDLNLNENLIIKIFENGDVEFMNIVGNPIHMDLEESRKVTGMVAHMIRIYALF